MAVQGRARLCNQNKHNVSKLDRQERMQQAIKLRREGLPYYEIATRMGIGKSQAFRLVADGHEELRKRSAEEAKYLREIEDERLQALFTEAYRIMENSDDDRKLLAMDRVLKISGERRKLWGADAPVKVQQSGAVGIYDAQDVMRRASAYLGNHEMRASLYALAMQVEAGIDDPTANAGDEHGDSDGGE